MRPYRGRQIHVAKPRTSPEKKKNSVIIPQFQLLVSVIKPGSSSTHPLEPETQA